MSNPNYSLEVISHHPQFKNKSLRKYYVDGIETVGAWGDEPFEIVFKNNTFQKVQVKFTLDGTDILSGEKATTEPSKDMWVVNGYATMSLKAWPETNNGGAQLIFTSANNSVAVHTHGDLSSRGIIAAAVFTEGHVAPVVAPTRINHYHNHDYGFGFRPYYYGNQNWYTLGGTVINSGDITCQDTFNTSTVTVNNTGAIPASSAVYNVRSMGATETKCSKSLESLAAVGAGQHVDQHITYVTGLVKPIFTDTVRVKYMWWDDLVAKLRDNNVPAAQASGFPGDKKQFNIKLGSTPRIGNFDKAFPREAQPSYLRV